MGELSVGDQVVVLRQRTEIPPDYAKPGDVGVVTVVSTGKTTAYRVRVHSQEWWFEADEVATTSTELTDAEALSIYRQEVRRLRERIDLAISTLLESPEPDPWQRIANVANGLGMALNPTD